MCFTLSHSNMLKVPWRLPFVTFEWNKDHYAFQHTCFHVMVLEVPRDLTVTCLKLNSHSKLTDTMRQQPFACFHDGPRTTVLNACGCPSRVDEAVVQTGTMFHDNVVQINTDALLLHYKTNNFFQAHPLMSYVLLVPLKINSIADFQNVLRDRRHTIDKQIYNTRIMVSNHFGVATYSLVTRKLEKSLCTRSLLGRDTPEARRSESLSRSTRDQSPDSSSRPAKSARAACPTWCATHALDQPRASAAATPTVDSESTAVGGD